MLSQTRTAEAPQWVTKELKDNPYYTRMHRMPGLAVCEIREDGIRVTAQEGNLYHTVTFNNGLR